MTTEVPGRLDSPLSEGLGPLATERAEVMRQLDDRTNQTWAAKRSRWGRFLRWQDAEIERERNNADILRQQVEDQAAKIERLRTALAELVALEEPNNQPYAEYLDRRQAATGAMTMEKHTPWFEIGDALQRPRRRGVYQLRSPSGHPHYSKWDGLKWCFSCATAREAEKQTCTSSGVQSYFYTHWRGLVGDA